MIFHAVGLLIPFMLLSVIRSVCRFTVVCSGFCRISFSLCSQTLSKTDWKIRKERQIIWSYSKMIPNDWNNTDKLKVDKVEFESEFEIVHSIHLWNFVTYTYGLWSQKKKIIKIIKSYCHYFQRQFIYYAGTGTEPTTSYTVVQTGLEIWGSHNRNLK